MKKKKIILIIPSLGIGGAEKITSVLCNYWDDLDSDIILIVFSLNNAVFNITNPHVQIIELKKKNLRTSMWKLFIIIKKTQPDIVFSTLFHVNIYLGFLKLLLFPNLKLIVRESSVWGFRNNSFFSYKMKISIKFIRYFYNRMDLVICQSKEMENDLIRNFKVGQKKICIINNPVENSLFELKNERDVLNGCVLLVSIGRLEKEKGFDRLIEIVSSLDFDFKLVIIGGGAEKKHLQKLAIKYGISNKIEFKGVVIPPFDCLKKANLFLQTSYVEGFPNALLEALALGVPSIAFNVPGGTKELIINGYNGYLVKDYANEDYAKIIKKAVYEKFNIDDIRKDIYNRFGVNKIMNGYKNAFYKSL